MWAPGPVCTGAENLAPTWIRSPDRPAGSQSLYRQLPGPLRRAADSKMRYNSDVFTNSYISVLNEYLFIFRVAIDSRLMIHVEMPYTDTV